MLQCFGPDGSMYNYVILLHLNFLTKAINTKILAFRLLTWWYLVPLVPLRMHHIDSNSLPICWKRCEVVSFIHYWWDSPKIKSFWGRVITHIKRITGYLVPMHPEVIFLNLWVGLDSLAIRKKIIAIQLTTAKALISFNWKSKELPTIAQWCREMWGYFIINKIAAQLSSMVSQYFQPNFLAFLPFLNISLTTMIHICLFQPTITFINFWCNLYYP